MPDEWREKPGPSDDIALAHRFDRNWRLATGGRFETDAAVQNQIKPVGRVSLSENEFALLKCDAHGAFSYRLEMGWGHASQEGVVGHELFE